MNNNTAKLSKSRNESKAEDSTADKKYTRPRNINLAFRVSQEEKDMIERRVAQSGMSNLRAYMVKMAIDGRIIHVELTSVREMIRLLSNATNNINQIAKVANETGNICARDVEVLHERVEEIWGQTKVILKKLCKL